MPLKPGSSNAVKSQNIREFHTGKTYKHTASKFGKHRADQQAVAVALSTARKYGKERGGKNMPKKMAGGGSNFMEDMLLHNASRNLHSEGMIHSTVPGRTDKLPMNVPAGSYVLPSDFISALGQNNSQAGGQIAAKMFNSGPMGMSKPPRMGGSRPMMPHLNMRPQSPKMPTVPSLGYAAGGNTNNVPIIAAGGEFVVSPDVVKDIGHGSMKAGHAVLDALVLKVRKEHIKTLQHLKPPKK